MKTLYLIRHAKSSWKYTNLNDFDRPLNKRGKRDAPFMGKRLKKFKIKPDTVISSPAERAFMTAKTIAAEINYPKDKIILASDIYESSTGELFKIIQSIDDSFNTVFLFGHNPGLTNIANFLSKKNIANIPTCGIFCLDFDIESWDEVSAGIGIFIFFDYPKKHL